MSLLSRIRRHRPTRAALHVGGAVAATLALAAAIPALAASPTLTPIAAIPMTSTTQANITSFDISFVDPVSHNYILGDRTQQAVDLVNTQNNSLYWLVGKGLFTGNTGNNSTSGPDGVLIANSNEIWAGDGNSTMKVFSLANKALIANISTGGLFRVDEMCFDPVDQLVMAANNADNPPFATIFSVATHTIVKQIKFDGTNGTPIATNGAEQCQYDPRNGLFVQTIPEINGPGDNSAPGGVVFINPKTLSVVATVVIPLSACSGPQGSSIGLKPAILIGCNGGPNMVALNGASSVTIDDGSTGGVLGAVLQKFPHQEGGDEVWYDSFSNSYLLAESAWNPPPPNGVASCSAPITAGPQHLAIVGAVAGTSSFVVTGLFNCPGGPTHGGNHSVAADATTGHVFFPVASNSGATLCSSMGLSDTTGCIMVFQATGCTGCATNVVWRDTSGDVALWNTNGSSVTSSTSSGSAPTNWSVVGRGDFAGNGNLDLLWRDTSGNVAIWQMSDGVVTSASTLGNVPTNWSVAGVGDFNGDGTADILWRDNSGNVAVWLMNNGAVGSAAVVGNVGSNWSVGGTYRNNVVWHDSSGNVAVWSMNGASVASAAAVGNVSTNWSIAGAGDFNGDGTTDILWHDTSGNNAVWLLNGSGGVASAVGLGNTGSSWNIAQTGDFNSDGTSDVLWRDTSGDVASWLMSNGGVASASVLGSVPTNWQIQGAN